MRTIVTVTSAATSSKLTTLERVKAELDITNGAKDVLLNAKIDEASSDCEAYLRFRVPLESVSQIYWHEDQPEYVDYLILDRAPVAGLDSITVDGELIDPSLYRIDPELGLAYKLNSSGRPMVWWYYQSITAVYSGGYILPGQQGRNLPTGIEGAVVELVTDFWLAKGRDPSVKSEEEPGVFRTEYWVGAVGETGELPPRVQMKLAPFRRAIA